MNIESSLKHFKWRLSSDKIIPNNKDIEAYNNIVAFISLAQQEALDKNRLLAKLMVFYMAKNAKVYSHNVKKMLHDIEECFGSTLTKNLNIFHEMIPTCSFIQLWNKNDDVYVTVSDPPTPYDLAKIKEAHLKQMKKFTEELKESLKTEYTIEQLTEFVIKKTAELTLKYQNNE